jgi:hypothetical protein
MFIQIVQGTCTSRREMRELTDAWCGDVADQEGWLGGTYGFTDDDRFVGVVRFTDGLACVRAANRPGASWYWARALELFDNSCEIHASDDITMMFTGGTDDASFVQVLQGRLRNAEKLRRLLTDQQMTTMLHEARPEILGATLAIEADGTFTETVSFTDEFLARRGESIAMPEQVTAALHDAIIELEYLDLREPWFASRS